MRKVSRILQQLRLFRAQKSFSAAPKLDHGVRAAASLPMSRTLEVCKNAASIAVDSVFNNVFAKLNGNLESPQGSQVQPYAPESSSPRALLDLPRDLQGPTVRWAIEEELDHFEKEEEAILKQKAKRTADRYSKTTDLLRRAKILEEQMKQKKSDVENLEGNEELSATGVEFPTMNEQSLVQHAQATDSDVFGGLIAAGGRRSIEAAGYTSPEELDLDLRKQRDAERRLRRRKKEVERKKKARLEAEAGEQEMLRRQLEQNEERRKRLAAEHEAERKRLLEERVQQQRAERKQRQLERDILKKKEQKLKKVKPKPLYKRMQEDFEERIMMPELIARKEKLAAIHKRFKEASPALSDIDMHQRAVDAQERLNKERSRLKKRGREKLWTQGPQYYTGQTKISIVKEHNEMLTKEQQKIRERKLIRAKQKAYGEFVRKIAAPKTDYNKAAEIQNRIQRLKNPAPLRKDVRDVEDNEGSVYPARSTPSPPPREPRPPRETAEELYRRTRNSDFGRRKPGQAADGMPTHRMRERDEEKETVLFLSAKEQAKEDMRLRRERRRTKALAERGIETSRELESPKSNDAIEARKADRQIISPRLKKETPQHTPRNAHEAVQEAEAHAKLSNMYMEAMKAKIEALEKDGTTFEDH